MKSSETILLGPKNIFATSNYFLFLDRSGRISGFSIIGSGTSYRYSYFSAVLTVLMSRILDLEIEDWELDDGQMVVSIFQYSSYFMTQGK